MEIPLELRRLPPGRDAGVGRRALRAGRAGHARCGACRNAWAAAVHAVDVDDGARRTGTISCSGAGRAPTSRPTRASSRTKRRR